MFERMIVELRGTPAVAYVQPSRYHVTVINRSHFDRGEVHAMDAREAQVVNTLIREAQLGNVLLDLQGLLLTPEGRLLACGYPVDDNLDRLRGSLARAWLQICALPELAHVKLAHVFQPLSVAESRVTIDWLARASHHLTARLRFTDAYTPHGRIGL